MQSQPQNSNNDSKTTSAPERTVVSSGSMPPPPPPPSKSAMLEREANALSACFKNAVVKTGQIYAFHADARRLGIHKYAPHPPRSLTSSLGRELQQYDQICDAIESQLLRAISVLKRDFIREERRAREVEQAAIAAQAPKIPLPSIEAGEGVTISSFTPGQGSPQGPATMPLRRQSAISLSSLNRNALPLKLDLSGSGMRISAEEVALFPKGLVPSPVSLAPKSARPSATADIDLMAAFASAAAANAGGQRVDIDLTVSESPPTAIAGIIDPALGNSADKPIELDIDGIDMEMSDMANLDSLFSPGAADSGAQLEATEGPQAQRGDIAMLGVLEGRGGQAGNLFGPVASGSGGGNQQPHSGNNVTPPSSSVSSFAQAGMQGSVGGFDLSTLDLSNLDPAWQNMSLTDMEALLNMPSAGQGSNQEGQKPGA